MTEIIYLARKQHWNLGNKTSDEVKEKIRKSNLGNILTDEQKQKNKIALAEYRNSERFVPSMLGKKLSDETKEKLSIKSKAANKVKSEKATLRIIEHLK